MFTCFIVIPQLQALHQPVALIPSYITVFQFSPGQVVTVASHLISSSHHLIISSLACENLKDGDEAPQERVKMRAWNLKSGAWRLEKLSTDQETLVFLRVNSFVFICEC